AFLVPYLLFMFFCGIPLFFMETSVGQNTRNAGVTVWRIVPIAKGIGFASIVLCSLMNIYVNVIVSWAIFYFIAIFQSVLPWSTCGNEWNTDDCVTTDMNISDRTNDSVASVEEYWENRVLKISTGIGDVNEFRWELFFTMAIAWLMVYGMLWRGLHNSGKLIWITALFPYVVMTILLIKAVTLPGAGTGIMYYLVPEWER
ncbi:PREDICTED: sodium- and chloride-dependent GABA transporter 2-like, partial [Priapulus caudatus]|uniref:Sodium- and chloride-dependent GABA transporter 2-like n=1 Tax=Priapulus caudatus TaxID=37621 RepID=A0ABM1F618_PRICU